MEYLQVTVTTTTEFSDLVSYYMCEEGSEGVCINDINDVREILSQKKWDYADDSLLFNKDERVYVSGFFPKDYKITHLLELLNKASEGYACGSLETVCSVMNSQDWENEWKKYYSPIPIKGVVIVPKWMKYEGKELQVLLDPGMAFGTGNHETTAMCIKLMQEYDLVEKNVADVGCGSGILGITALKLGAKSCTFTDIDPLAVDATKENCKLNDVKNIKIINGNLLEHITEKMDFAVANITADVLKILAPVLKEALKKQAPLVISGIIHERAQEVYDLFSKLFTPLIRMSEGEWQAMSFLNDK